MKVIRAKVLGFCMGVRRAEVLAVSEAQRSAGLEGKDSPRVYTLGPLVHNPRVLDDLKKHGVEVLENIPSNLEGSSVVIRAHGVSPVIEKQLQDSGCYIVDATCPNVKASQLIAEEYARTGYCIFLAGEARHAEIEGIMGYAQAAAAHFCTVVASALEARLAAGKLYRIDSDAKTVLLGQTTITESEYNSIGEALKLFFPNLEIVPSICAATSERQQALRELLCQVDAVVIAGGKESANTRRLLSIAQESGKPCVLAENAKDIGEDFFNFETVGLCAGASAPDSVIDEIEQALLR